MQMKKRSWTTKEQRSRCRLGRQSNFVQTRERQKENDYSLVKAYTCFGPDIIPHMRCKSNSVTEKSAQILTNRGSECMYLTAIAYHINTTFHKITITYLYKVSCESYNYFKEILRENHIQPMKRDTTASKHGHMNTSIYKYSIELCS